MHAWCEVCECSSMRVRLHGVITPSAQVLLGGPSLVEPRLLAAVRGLVATFQSEVENLTLEVLGSWDRPLNKRNEVGAPCWNCLRFVS
jgi:hypothetical protein